MSANISVIVATRNAAGTLRACLDSILCQTYSDYEILIQDAMSDDDTAAILRSYRDPRVRATIERDHGIYDAWNRALGRARGDWIMFLGADDRLAHPQVLGRRTELLGRTFDRVDLVCSRIAFVNEKGAIQKVVGTAWNWPILLTHQNVAHIGMMHHRSLFKKFGLFDTRYRIAGDYEFLLRLGEQTRALFMDEVEVLAGCNGISQTNILRVMYEGFHIQSNRGDIGLVQASRNLMVGCLTLIHRCLRKPFE